MANRMKSASDQSPDLFLRAVAQTSKIIAGIKPEQWHNATPCAEWDLRVLVNHVIGEHRWLTSIFGGGTIASVGDSLEGDLTGDDPIATYMAAAAEAVASYDKAILDGRYDVSIGDITGYDYTAQLFMDQLVHGWDIMKGSGQQIQLDDDLASQAIPVAQEMVAFVGQGSVFGNTLDVGGDVPSLALLLGTLGRSVDWQPPAGAIFQ
jgi:uncharacterized protein (TIGR03086 family)